MEHPSSTEDAVTYTVGQETSTECDHIYQEAPGDANSNLSSAQCEKCWHGISYDPTLFIISNGKLTPLGEHHV